MTTTATTSKPVTGEPRLASFASWAVLVASFGLSATTWVALAVLAGFTGEVTIKGVTVLKMAWLMPVAIDGYVVVALVLWMSPVPAKVAAFAKKNTYGAALLGVAAQSAYHLLHTASTTDETWRVVLAAIVGAAPPSVAAGAVHMRALIRRESNTKPGTVPESSSTPTHDQPSTHDNSAVPAPVADTAPPSTPDSGRKATTGRDPNLVPVVIKVPAEPVPTPAAVAARITKTPQASTRTNQATVPAQTARPTRSPRPHKPAPPASKLAPSTTDTPVTESDRAQLTLPVVAGDVLAKAERAARQYRTEHGVPIRPAQLAARIKVTSEEAAQALAVLNLGPNPPTTPAPTVNGNRPKGGTSR
ncbi:hypothetical protein RB614_37555 [Phytohabitans sp. ZYX-F-186]|uniref:DUF2637 domain-containing protein n=1 Tax=Phytohabitans maris TaxID=3071409 RepID=A0ABU0ZT51_9ACTN|nr:hypothetical protein [Phytohabitans sp. ZYX-F-186]MDQ7910218.1 hypothetical protein [Phytohabitans sp. ZYX-F-186]